MSQNQNLHRQGQSPRRNGSTLGEIIVSAVLLVAMMSFASTLIVRTSRIWRQTRHVQLCMDELSNHMERLISLDDQQRAAALASLETSSQLRSTLPDAEISSETISDADGVRLVLSIRWQPQPNAVPTRLVGWFDPMPQATVESPEDEGDAS